MPANAGGAKYFNPLWKNSVISRGLYAACRLREFKLYGKRRYYFGEMRGMEFRNETEFSVKRSRGKLSRIFLYGPGETIANFTQLEAPRSSFPYVIFYLQFFLGLHSINHGYSFATMYVSKALHEPHQRASNNRPRSDRCFSF